MKCGGGLLACGMRTKLLVGVVGLIVGHAFQPVQADIIGGHKISVTGTILQEVGSDGQTSIKPLTIKNILGVLGLTGTDPKSVRYYYDSTGPSFVIATKANGGDNNPLATVFNFNGGNYVTWSPTGHSFVASGQANGLGGDVTGVYYESGITHRTTASNKTSFTFFGEVGNFTTIMKGTIVDTFNPVQ